MRSDYITTLAGKLVDGDVENVDGENWEDGDEENVRGDWEGVNDGLVRDVDGDGDENVDQAWKK